MSSRPPQTTSTLTTTSYALLGLLALRPWSAYELTTQMRRVFRFVAPRADSKVYEAAKRLVGQGYATAAGERIGRRPRTTYTITPAGREVLDGWLRLPSGGPVLEFESAVKVFFADLVEKPDVLAILAAITDWAGQMREFGAELGREYIATDGGPYPGRLHINTLINELLLRHITMIGEWSEWATEQVSDWEGTGPQPHRHHLDLQSYHRAGDTPTTIAVGELPAR